MEGGAEGTGHGKQKFQICLGQITVTFNQTANSLHQFHFMIVYVSIRLIVTYQYSLKYID